MSLTGNSTSGAPGATALGALRRFFFYGILQNPLNHYGLGMRALGPAQMRGDLFRVGSAFPAMVDGDGIVHGTVWEAPYAWQLEALKTFDAIEGYSPSMPHRSMYIREPRLCLEPGGLEAWVYVWNGGTDKLTPLPGGAWTRGGVL